MSPASDARPEGDPPTERPRVRVTCRPGLLREVLSWEAAEVAELLDMSVAAVNSALQRARATLDAEDAKAGARPPLSDAQQALSTRYMDAFQRLDFDALVSLLHEEATWSMPPYRLWLRGRPSIRSWLGQVGSQCRGSLLLPTAANGTCAIAQYRPSGPDGAFEPWALQVVDMSEGRITGVPEEGVDPGEREGVARREARQDGRGVSAERGGVIVVLIWHGSCELPGGRCRW